jgi:hypothetical protein
MTESVERSTLDLRYEGYRVRDGAAEARLRASIAERGIDEPLEGVDKDGQRILLNGFKRYRCAKKLRIETVPYVSLGEEEAPGIICLMKTGKQRGLNLLEQAKFTVELLGVHQLSPAEVAEMLGRSKSWVSMRRNLLDEMSAEVQRILFRGAFPVYAYMYTLRPFMRLNSFGKAEVERFVKALAGKRLSVREIDMLARGYFQGPASLREAIDQGKWNWSLEQMKQVPKDPNGCNDFERALLKDLKAVQTLSGRVMLNCRDDRLQSPAFHAEANLLTGSLLSQLPPFLNTLREFHDRSGNA